MTVAEAAEELLQEAMFRTLDGRRTWDAERVPIIPFLAFTMRSKITDDARTAALHKRQAQMVVDEFQRPTPIDEALDQVDVCQGIADRLLDAAQGDSILEKVAFQMIDGVGKPQVIAEAT